MRSLHILVAYPYMSKAMVRALASLRQVCDVHLMLDSGAFTAWKSGHPINLAEYCDFLADPAVPFQHAVQLDVIGDHQATMRNYDTMRERGLRVMPVFTRGAPFSDADRFYETTDYLLFGGIVSTPGNREYLKWFTNQNRGRKVHWLGFTNRDFITAFRPYSADSSSWNFALRSGKMRLYTGKGVLKEFQRDDVIRGGVMLDSLLARHGISPPDRARLRTESAWRGGASVSFRASTAAAILRAQDTQSFLGTKLYLAAATGVQINMIREAVESLALQY
jgi:hypothetical protein